MLKMKRHTMKGDLLYISKIVSTKSGQHPEPAARIFWILLLFIVLGSGCGGVYRVPITPHVGPMEIREKLPMEAAIVITREMKNHVIERKSDDVKGVYEGFRRYEFLFGEALETASIDAFSQVFQKVTIVRTSQEAKKYPLYVQPSIKDFNFRHDSKTYNYKAFALLSNVKVSIKVSATNGVIWERTVETPEQKEGPWRKVQRVNLVLGRLASRSLEYALTELARGIATDPEVWQAIRDINSRYATTQLPAAVKLSAAYATDVERIAYGQCYALVIGNNGYHFLPKLKTPINDATSVTQILRGLYGFSVTLLLDVTRREIVSSLDKLRHSLTAQDNLLIYYAGHGWLDEAADEGYWLPVDATRDSAVNWVSNSSITATLRAIRAKHVMVVADSCYSGKLVRGIHITRKDPNYLGRIAKKKARVVLSSGGLEPVVDGGTNGMHSVFATAFMEALRENKKVLDGTELFSKIRRPVMVNSDQTPEYGDIRKAGHAGGDFLFVRHK